MGQPRSPTDLEPRPTASASFDLLFDALADTERLRLLARLEHFPAAARILGLRLGWTRDATAKQLQLLKRAGLVRGEAFGETVEYRLAAARLDATRLWLAKLWFSAAPTRLDSAQTLDVDRQVALCAALRTPGRRRLLEEICRGAPLTQKEAGERCSLAQGLTSRGLTQLVDVELVSAAKDGRPHLYAAAPAGLAAALRWLAAMTATASAAERFDLQAYTASPAMDDGSGEPGEIVS